MDATGTPVGIYYLYLESFDTTDGLAPTLRTDMIQIEVTNYIRDVVLDSPLIITQGDILEIQVPNVDSEIAITPTLDINLRQPSDGTALGFITFVEEAGYTRVIIDTNYADIGYETLFLESFNTLEAGLSTLRLDQIEIQITGYVRDDPIVSSVQIRKDESLVIIVPNCYSSIAIATPLSVDIRQDPSSLLTFVSITEFSATSEVFIDATGLEPYSTHDLYIQSYNTLSADLVTLRTDLIQVLILPKACDIFQKHLDAFVALY